MISRIDILNVLAKPGHVGTIRQRLLDAMEPTTRGSRLLEVEPALLNEELKTMVDAGILRTTKGLPQTYGRDALFATKKCTYFHVAGRLSALRHIGIPVLLAN